MNIARNIKALGLLVWLLSGCATHSPAVLTPTAVREHPDHYVVVAVRNDMPAYSRAGTTTHRYENGGYLESSRARQLLRAIAGDYQLRAVSGWPIPALAMQCVIFKMYDGADRQILLDKLQRDQRIALAQPLQTFATNTDATPSYDDPYAPLQTNLAQMGIYEAQRWSRGKDVRIAIVDTGIDVTHPELRERVVVQRNFVDDDARQFVADRHGTAIAGVIAANANNGIGIVGIAPQAKLFALKACWQLKPDHDAAACNSFTLAQALMSAIELHAHIINLSLIGPSDPLLTALIERAQQSGIIVIGAAGGGDNDFPARVKRVIVAAGMESDPTDNASMLYAPGRDVMTLRPGNRYDFSSGNSIATAEVTGATALLLADARTEKSLRFDVEHIRQTLQQSGSTKAVTNSINVCLAMMQLHRVDACPSESMHLSSN